MNMLRAASLLLTALGAGATAHHSFASICNSGQCVTLTGSVPEFLFVHPHPFLVVEAGAEEGKPETCRAEMDSRFELESIGMTLGTFVRVRHLRAPAVTVVFVRLGGIPDPTTLQKLTLH